MKKSAISKQAQQHLIDNAHIGRLYTKDAWWLYRSKRKASFHGAVFFKGSKLEIFDTLDGDVFIARWTSEKRDCVEVFPSCGGRIISSELCSATVCSSELFPPADTSRGEEEVSDDEPLDDDAG